jgi:hypothetical protein
VKLNVIAPVEDHAGWHPAPPYLSIESVNQFYPLNENLPYYESFEEQD